MSFLIRPSMLLVIMGILPFQVTAIQKPDSSHIRLELRLAEVSKSDGLIEATVERTNETIYLHKEVLISNKDVTVAQVVISDARKKILDQLRAAGVKVESDEKDWYEVQLSFTKEAAQRIEKATQKHLNKRIAIIIDGVVVSAPILAQKISNGAIISGGSALTKERAEKIANSLNRK